MIFDFGNVVAFFDHREACRKLSRMCTLGPNQIYEKIFAAGQLNDRFERGEVNSTEFLKELRGSLEIETSIGDQILKHAWNEIFRPNPDVMERLADFKLDCRLVLASNTNSFHMTYVTEHPDFHRALSIFDHKVLSYEIGQRKPDRAFYEHALKHIQCEPAECLFLDDMLENVEMGRAVGMQSCQYVKSLDESIGSL